MRAKALLFDMDGTLIDSGVAIQAAWNRWAGRYGFDGVEVYEYSHGRKAEMVMAHFLPGRADPAATASEADAFHADIAAMSDTITAIPGARELVGQLRPHEWAVVTSAPVALARRSLSAAGLPLPEIIVGADLVARSKPDPEGFLLAMHRLGAPARQSIAFEDAEAGLQAARAAQAQVVGVGRQRQHAHLTDHWTTDYAGVEVRRGGLLELRFPAA